MEILSYMVYVLVLLLAHLVQGITGFGGVVLALPALSFFFPVKTLIPALVVVNLAQVSWFAVTGRKRIHPDHVKSIVLLSLAGLPFGFAVYRFLPSDVLKVALGVFVVMVALWNLSGVKPKSSVPLPLYHLLNFLGGFIQGALACGGPFLVIYAARMLEDKSSFRATLCVAWTVLNLLLCITYTATRTWSTGMVPLIGFAFPSVILGTVLGTLLHDRIPMKPFRILVFSILLVSGLVLLDPVVG